MKYDIKSRMNGITMKAIYDEAAPPPHLNHPHSVGTYLPPQDLSRMMGTAPITTYLDAEGDSMATANEALTLYEVIIVDSREADDDVAVGRYSVRATDAQTAKLRAILRAGYKESDIKFLDFDVRTYMTVKPVVEDEGDE